MSESVTPLRGAERIRALTNEDAIFQTFDAYPWKKDAMFMAGLLALLGNPSDFGADAVVTINNMATQARIFYYAQRVGVVIDYSKYYAWLGKHPDHRRPMFHADTLANPPSPSRKRGSRSPLAPAINQQSLVIQTHSDDDQVSDVTDKLSRLDTGAPMGKGNGKEILNDLASNPSSRPPTWKEKGKEKAEEKDTHVSDDLASSQPNNTPSGSPKDYKDIHQDKDKCKDIHQDKNKCKDKEKDKGKGKGKGEGKGKEKEILSEPRAGSVHNRQPDTHPPHQEEHENARQSSSNLKLPIAGLPSWQAVAPKAELYVDRRDSSAQSPAPSNQHSQDEPSYPLRFADMIKMLQEDIAIPGIRQIPDTIIRDPAVKPFGVRVAPRKPWEQMEAGTVMTVNYATPHDKLDLEFPPL